MSEPAAALPAIESPCIGVCRLDESGTCVGCFRTIREIGAWLSYTPEQRRAIIEALPQRASRRFEAG